VIPSIRPELWTKPAADVETEVRGLLGSGFKEIVLCGVRLGRYLDDSGRRVDFVGMMRRLLSIEGEWRLRLSSFEITDVTDRFLARRGTPAARYRQLPEEVVERRSREMRALDRTLRLRHEKAEKGKSRTALVEKSGAGLTETFLRVAVAAGTKVGTLTRVTV